MNDNGNGKVKITVDAIVNKPIESVWEKWTLPQHIMQWNNASEDWYTPSAENDLRVGGKFSSLMSARDGSYRFEFGGTYDEVILGKKIAYTLGDDRKVVIEFIEQDKSVKIIETFEAEGVYPPEQQKAGWQSIMDNFKKYVENG